MGGPQRWPWASVTPSVLHKNLTFPEDAFLGTEPAVSWGLGLRVGVNLSDSLTRNSQEEFVHCHREKGGLQCASWLELLIRAINTCA